MSLKSIFFYTILLPLNFYIHAGTMCSPCSPNNDTAQQDNINETILNFNPNIHITEQTEEDKYLLEKIRPLFFEADPNIAKKISANTENIINLSPKRSVYTKCLTKHNAQERILLTDDNFRISSLYFHNPQARVNLVYVTGYFFDQTPTKEWVAPFYLIHNTEIPEHNTVPVNMLAFDHRSFGNSEGNRGKLSHSDFGANSFLDIQAAVDFFRKENSLPIVLIGFCQGGAMALKATVEAQKNNKNMADGIVLNCIFSRFENQYNRATVTEDRLLPRILLKSGIGKIYLNSILNGSLFTLNPIESIQELNLPIYFEHYKDDPFAILPEGIEVYNSYQGFKMFLQSDLGRHARIHTKVPLQYRNAFYSFLYKSGLIQ